MRARVGVRCAVGWWEVSAISPAGASLVELGSLPPTTELLPRLPEEAMLLVGNSEPPRFLQEKDENMIVLPAP